MEKKEAFVKEVLVWISDSFGSETSILYEKFYKNLDFETIYEAVNELMSEYMGEKRALETLSTIKTKIGIS